MVKLILNIQNDKKVSLQLKRGSILLDELHLTVSQGFDTLLIRTIDKLLVRNRIDRLSLKSVQIQGKLRPGAVSSMTIKTIKSAFGAT